MTTMRLVLAVFLASTCAAGASAAERETLSFSQVSRVQQIQNFMFPEAQCEDQTQKYECMSVRPSTERAVIIDVRFNTGSSELTPQAKAQLDNIGKALASRRGKLGPGEIRIEGHTDVRGTAEYNQKLSESRAQAVAKHLVSAYGVDPASLKLVGRGKDKLKDSSHPDSEANRRVEFVRAAN